MLETSSHITGLARYHSATATTVKDTQKLVEAGLEYVCDFNEVKVFGKRK